MNVLFAGPARRSRFRFFARALEIDFWIFDEARVQDHIPSIELFEALFSCCYHTTVKTLTMQVRLHSLLFYVIIIAFCQVANGRVIAFRSLVRQTKNSPYPLRSTVSHSSTRFSLDFRKDSYRKDNHVGCRGI